MSELLYRACVVTLWLCPIAIAVICSVHVVGPPTEAALLGVILLRVILQATCPRCSNGGNREPVGDLGRAAEYFQESLAYQTAIRAGVAPYGR